MKEFWNLIQTVFAGLGGWLGYYLGGWDGVLFALVGFMVIDYVTGVLCAFEDRSLSSEQGFKGIARKVMILVMVGIGHALDMVIIGEAGVLRSTVIFYYMSNEGLSILENMAHLGLPIPTKLKDVLVQLHKRAEEKEETNDEGN